MVKIFKQEEKDGLAEKIKSDNSIALNLEPVNQDILERDFVRAVANIDKLPKQIDLFYFESILVSVGWNKNDDVFDKAELWQSKETPINKQINYMHDERDIIGHMITSRVIDDKQTLIDYKTPAEQIPDKLDIVVGGVLYKIWETESLQERMDRLIAEIGQNKWKVSMECRYPHFDYAIITPEGQHKVIARDEKSSFLSKYLRRYGGDGKFDGYRIGRVLRNITFTGKGIVDEPANPRSIITKTEYSDFLGAAASVNILPKRGKVMEITEVQYNELKVRLEKAEAAAKEAAEKAFASEKAALEAVINDLKTKETNLTTELSAAKEVSKAHEVKIQTLEADLAAKATELDEANQKIAEANQIALKAKRLAMFNEVDVDTAKAEELVTKFLNASDDIFEELVKAMPKKKVEAEKKMEDKKEEKKEEEYKKDKADVDEALKNAEMTDTSETVAPDEATSAKAKMIESARAWFSSNFKYTKQNGDK